MAKTKADVLSIDKDLLDEEWEEQPRLFERYAGRLADAKLLLDEAENEVELSKAMLDKAIREQPKKYGFKDKAPSETAIKNVIILQDSYQAKLKDVRTSKHNVNMLDAMVKALEHRKRGLEKMVDLHGQQYFASPRARGESKEALQDAEVRGRGRRARYREDEEDDG